MIRIEENVSLLSFNTFGIDVRAKFFVQVDSIDQLQELIQFEVYKREKRLVLGGGSNILFTHDFEGLVVKMAIKGISKVKETDTHVWLKSGAGEVWHDLVMHCIDHNWGGIENLSLIPGSVGAAPLQNIGAYGVEIKNVIEDVECINIDTGSIRHFNNEECCFGYRESVFKQELKEKYFISSVTLSLTNKNHQLMTTYGAIQETLSQLEVHNPTIRDISNAVINIRKNKLPDPLVIGNAGSFFKNPIITAKQYQSLKTIYPTIPGYSPINQDVKVPAGWLIEQCGWKGKTFQNIGVHAHQALVLVNYGGGKGDEIFLLAEKIKRSVLEKFGVKLMTEVNIF
ncbi:MAG: UDP-N-acetylmuramate dehydrogenase [Bacteroidota bacterium]